MKNIINIKQINLNNTITVLCVLFLLIFANNSTAQLSQYIMNQDDNMSLYNIKNGMEIYLDSLESAQDSSTFFAEGGEYNEYMKFMYYWEMRLMPHGDFNRIFDADSMYYLNNQGNYPYFSDKAWQEVGPFEQSSGIGPVEYLSIFDDGTVESTQYMLVSSLLGGVFYSTDYGDNWSSTATDTQWELSGSSCAIFHPTIMKHGSHQVVAMQTVV